MPSCSTCTLELACSLCVLYLIVHVLQAVDLANIVVFIDGFNEEPLDVCHLLQVKGTHTSFLT